MRAYCLLFVIFFVLSGGCSPLPAPVPTPAPTSSIPPALALTHARLIDGSGAEPVADAVLLIGGGKIVAVGKTGEVALPPGIQVVDLGGRTVLPGFFNAHVHGAINKERLSNWAQHGVTSVCDMSAGSNFPATYTFRDASRAKPHLAWLATAGPMLTVPGGYPIAYWNVSALTAESPAEAVKWVNTLLNAGADYIKIPLESGKIFGQTMPMHPPEQAKAIVNTAHQRQSKVVAHISIAQDLEKALDAGVDVLAHMSTDRVPDAVLKRVISQGVIWIPTLELWERVAPYAERVEDNLKRFTAAGGKVALGTDFLGAPNVDFEENMPMFEINRMRAVGMTPMQIIVSATQNAALACNQQATRGTLQPGKSADLVVTQGDPLKNLAVLENPWLVMRTGVIIRESR